MVTRIRFTRPALIAIVVGLLEGSAFAHKLEIKRTLVLEPSGEHDLQILIALRVPSGAPRKTLSVLADQNHDGRVDDREEKAMRRLLAIRALDGIRLLAGTSSVAIDNMETKLKVDGGEGPVDLAVHGVAHLPAQPGDVALTVATAVVGDPLDLVVLPGNRPVMGSDRGQARDGGLKVTLGQGDRARIRLADRAAR
jgi:hypothetical protein